MAKFDKSVPHSTDTFAGALKVGAMLSVNTISWVVVAVFPQPSVAVNVRKMFAAPVQLFVA
jgi:hypothetical protein